MSSHRLRLFGPVQLLARDGTREWILRVQPKPLALLAYVALEGAHGVAVRRDVLLARFWPELDDERARAALRQALFHLRRAIGEGVLPLRADDSVGLDAEALDCDALAFDAALERDAPAEALALYRAPLFAGYHADGVSAELEQWMDAARQRYARAACAAAWKLAERAAGASDAVAAGHWVRCMFALAPDDEIVLRQGLALLDRIGDRAGALAAAAAFERRLAEEFGAAPDATTRSLVARLRAAPAAADDAPTVDATPPAVVAASAASAASAAAASAVATATVVTRPRTRRWRVTLSATLLAAVVLGAGVATRTAHGRDPAPASVQRDALDPATITVRSPIARGLFAEGLGRLYAQGDAVEAARLFESALREDSTCAMCAFAAARAKFFADEGASHRLLRTAVRLSAGATPRERLVIRQWWASVANAPEQLALAESLAVRYPDDPEAGVALGAALEADGRYLDAVAQYERVLRMPTSARGTCPRCDARAGIIDAYWDADSIDAALRAAQSWTRADPAASTPWMALARALTRAGRDDEASAALDRVVRLEGGTSTRLLDRAVLALHAERYDSADAALRLVAATGTATDRQNALWWRAIALRYRGRPAEALALVQGPLRWSEGRQTSEPYPNGLLEGQVLLELGRARDAATRFRALSAQRFADSSMPGVLARQRAWALAHAGTALAAAGDTIALAALIDTVELVGQRSALARDQRLHHYLRGLLWKARGASDSAIAAFDRAAVSRSHGFTRIAYEEAPLLLATGRARDAVRVLSLALHGEMESSNLYVTRPALHEALARAYESAGMPDSAVAQWNAVVRAWRDGEPAFRARAAAARARVAVLLAVRR